MSFKEGDIVICLENHRGQFTRGKVYKVRGVEHGVIFVEQDDKGSKTNGWRSDYFKHASKTAQILFREVTMTSSLHSESNDET